MKYALSFALLALTLAGCGNGSGSDSSIRTQGDSVSNSGVATGDVPIAYVKRASSINLNPTDGSPTAPGGDLIIREKSSPSATEHNITLAITQGVGDVSDPEASYDGKKLVFSMRCPTSNTSTINEVPACTGRWNIWEYDMTGSSLTAGTFRRLTSSTLDDDVDPAYLPAGKGFVFSSNRQTQSRINQALGQTYYALDEYERERVLNLHTMDAAGGQITQISVNQSHDRNPVVRPNGDIMFSRWDHVGGRNHFKIFRVKPDGTDMFVLYGAHSAGNSFLHPRDMDPAGSYQGYLASAVMPLSRTDEGGALMFIDAANYSEQNTPANASVPTLGGQRQATAQTLSIGGGLSNHGRVTTPYPLWDGTDRVLLAYAPCQVSRAGKAVSCATLSDAEKTRLSDDNRMAAAEQADELQMDVPPPYAIYMFDPAKQTWRNVASPPGGSMYTDPIALQARAEPSAMEPSAVDASLASQGLGLLAVRSIYDTDGLGRMGDAVLADADLATGCTTAIAKTAPTDPLDARAQVADLRRMKDPADAAYRCAPAVFVRAVRAIAPPSGMTGLRGAIGETEFEQQQILGYAPIEPDGSFKLNVPADVPIALAVIDAQGRAFQTHTNWIQVRPGERRTCDGCHSPRRGGALNSGAVVNAMPSALKSALSSAHQSGETMADTRTRLDPSLLMLKPDMLYTDAWADTTQSGVTGRPAISIKYTGNTNPADDLVTAVPSNGVINYPEHVAPLWTRSRGAGGAHTCTACHSDPAKLDLRSTVSGTGRTVSYDELMMGDPFIDPDTGQPRTIVREGVTEIDRASARVDTAASEGEALGLSRKSRFVEIMFGQNLMADADVRTLYPSPPSSAPNHATLLNAAEKRLVAEWIDLGSQYYNDPFNSSSGVRTVSALSQATFTEQVLPILRTTCAAACHQAIGSSASAVPVGSSFRNNRFVLTGNPEGDFGVTLSMISDTCTPASNILLSKPSTVPHPAGAVGQLTPVLALGSANYTAIANWISSGCP